MDLPFDFNFLTAGKNKSVELYSEEPEGSPLYRNLFQVDICHDGRPWYGTRGPREGER